VRELVTSLLVNKPVVLPDQTFVADLRARLLVAHSTKPVNEHHILSPWFRYLAPIGVVAVLIFIMVPKPLTHQAVPIILNEATELDSMADETIESAVDSAEVPSNAIDAKRSFMAPETVPSRSDMKTMEMALPVEVPGETFSISTQAPGQLIRVDFVSFLEPTFFVIQRDRDGKPAEVVGVSQVLSGEVSEIEIVLMTKMLKDETFFATAYRDNGDGIYTPDQDSLVFDTSGVLPLQQMFSTSQF